MHEEQPEDTNESEGMARVRAKFSFLQHLATYVVVIGGLACINLLSNPRFFWFLWPALGWGIGLAAHAVSALAMPLLLQRMIKREMRRPHS